MKTGIFTLLVVILSMQCRGNSPVADARVVIGQPSIFWHDGEWQTYNNGVWTPYGKAEPNRFAQPRSNQSSSNLAPGNIGSAHKAGLGKSTSPRDASNAGIGATTIGIGQPNGIGQSTGGIGQPNVGIGRTTIGIGKPNGGIGQPNGIGQTTFGIGKPNVGIGQPNTIGQTTIGIGKPASFPSQQRNSSDTPK